MKPWIKTLLISLAILLVTGGAIALMAQKDPEEPTLVLEEPHWEARTATISLGEHRPQITLIGSVEPNRDLNVSAKLSAEVLGLNFSDGDVVKAGDTIAVLDDFDAQMQLSQTQADLADLTARRSMQTIQHRLDVQALDVEKNQLQLLRDQLKKQQNIGTQATIDDLNQQIQRQQFAVLQLEAAIQNHDANEAQLSAANDKLVLALQAAERNLSETNITAPFDGKLAQVMVQIGETVTPGQPIFRLYSEDDMSVKVQLPVRLVTSQSDLDGVAYEQNRTTPVTFDRSEAQLVAGQSGFNAWFNLEDTRAWLPGDVVYLAVNLAAQADTMKVPASAVFQDRWIYTVDENQKLQAQQVSVLGSTENDVIVQPFNDIGANVRLLTTRLNNPTTGMKIYEAGVDPEPVKIEENSEDETDKQDDESDEGDDA